MQTPPTQADSGRGNRLETTTTIHDTGPHHMTERRATTDRRSGKDRRQDEQGPPTGYERRRTVESRQPELTELHLSEEELRALGFTQDPPEPQKPA